MSILVFILIILFSLTFEAFFSGSEIALISSDRLELHKQSAMGSFGAKRALQLLSKPEKILATTLVGTNICITLQAVTTSIFIHKRLGSDYEIYSLLFLTPLILIFGEIIPKTIAQRYSEKIAPKVSLPISYAGFVLSPITYFLGKYTDKLSKLLYPLEALITGKQLHSHREELRYLLTYGQKETSLKNSEKKMIRRILDFSKAEAKRAMIPLVRVDMIEDTLTIAEALKKFHSMRHSRLPIYRERVDNVIGVVHFLDAFAAEDKEKMITEVMRPAKFAPETQLLEHLMRDMQREGLLMTIIVDEYGGAVGIATLEDILEEIVGEIEDEYDTNSSLYKEIAPNSYLVQSQMEISAINEVLKTSIPKGEYETLSGFLLQQFNKIPEDGDELYFMKYKFTIKRASKKSIQSVRLDILDSE